MPRSKKLAIVEEPEQVEPEEVEEDTGYQFEQPTEDLVSRLNVMGNSIILARDQIQKDYPEWARCLTEFMANLKTVKESFDE